MHELGRMRNGSKQEPRADINFKRGIRKKNTLALWIIDRFAIDGKMRDENQKIKRRNHNQAGSG